MDSENINNVNPSLSDHDYPLTESVASTGETRSLAKQPIPTKIYDSESAVDGRNSRSRQNILDQIGIGLFQGFSRPFLIQGLFKALSRPLEFQGLFKDRKNPALLTGGGWRRRSPTNKFSAQTNFPPKPR